MPWLLALAGVAVLAIAVEIGLRTVLWRRLEAVLSEAIGGSTTVRVPGSRLIGLGRGFDAVEIRSVDVPIVDGRSRLARLDVDLAWVRVRPSRTVTGGGTFAASLTAAQLRAAVALPAVFRDIRVEDDHLRVVVPGGFGLDALLSIDDGSVVLEPLSLVAALANVELRWPLPTLPLAAEIEEIRCLRGTVGISGRVPAGPVTS